MLLYTPGTVNWSHHMAESESLLRLAKLAERVSGAYTPLTEQELADPMPRRPVDAATRLAVAQAVADGRRLLASDPELSIIGQVRSTPAIATYEPRHAVQDEPVSDTVVGQTSDGRNIRGVEYDFSEAPAVGTLERILHGLRAINEKASYNPHARQNVEPIAFNGDLEAFVANAEQAAGV